MPILKCLTGLVLACCLAGSASAKTKAPSLRDQEQAACYKDATTLCNEFVPDEAKITSCMTAKFDQVSPGCKVFFKVKD